MPNKALQLTARQHFFLINPSPQASIHCAPQLKASVMRKSEMNSLERSGESCVGSRRPVNSDVRRLKSA
jgi:hypothetical protein